LSCVLAVSTLQCGPTSPSKSLTGNWHFTDGKRRIVEMSLTQTNFEVRGDVCAYALNPAGPAHRATVMGEYPNLRITDPFNFNCVHEAEYEEDRDQIAGDCGSVLVRFSRGGSGTCQGAAQPR
jgi:hypothetical protein